MYTLDPFSGKITPAHPDPSEAVRIIATWAAGGYAPPEVARAIEALVAAHSCSHAQTRQAPDVAAPPPLLPASTLWGELAHTLCERLEARIRRRHRRGHG